MPATLETPPTIQIPEMALILCSHRKNGTPICCGAQPETISRNMQPQDNDSSGPLVRKCSTEIRQLISAFAFLANHNSNSKFDPYKHSRKDPDPNFSPLLVSKKVNEEITSVLYNKSVFILADSKTFKDSWKTFSTQIA